MPRGVVVMSIRSHVQNSKFIIKRFKISDSNGNVRALDLNDWTIKDKGPMETGTIEDYFDENAEQFLSQKYEGPVGKIVSNVIKANENGTSYTVSVGDIENLKKFLMMLFLRNPAILDSSYDKTVLAKQFGLKPTPSHFLDLIDIKIPEFVARYLANLKTVLIFNKNTTGRVFVSSVKGFSVVGELEKNTAEWWLPVSPYFGIAFVDDNYYKEVFQSAHVVDLTDDSMFDYLNRRIVDATINDGGSFVFSNTDLELEKIKSNRM